MENKDKNYLLLIGLHVLLGILIFLFMPFSKLYALAILAIGLYITFKSQNKHHEVLYICGYLVGSEVFLRMTQGNPIYEYSKYGVMAFVFLGMYFKGFSRNAVPYWLFLLLLVPGIILGTYNLNYDTDLARIISFNISGPLCLGVVSLYTFNRPITIEGVQNIMLSIGLPVVSCTTYLFLYTPSIRDVITGTSSNFEASGGFGPNQVSTILGLGAFVFFSRVFFASKNKLNLFVNLGLAIFMSYRGLVTFSRGGVITCAIMLIILVLVTYFKVGAKSRGKLNMLLVLFSLAIFAVWSYSSLETGGLIEKRYANQDAAGRVKKSKFTGREKISESEVAFFLSSPIVGIGVGKGLENRENETGLTVLSHNEITRVMAEHGSLGILALIILFGTPFFLYLDNKDHIYIACFVCFWLLTINHAAMRTAAPAFVYALSILKVVNYEKPTVRRQ
ncbi:O-antigen polymerase [Flavobacterium longum]|uniref:O-antigen ligase family protein n=1 Tax=Flavobacterium longum TaxID=1299340 RepID=UPI0039E8CD69